MTSQGLRTGAVALVLAAAALAPLARAAGEAAPPDPGVSVHPQALLAHMRFLADDRLEGRGTGTRGYELAALYVATQFEALGLKPAGAAGSYYQPVPLRSASVNGARCTLSWSRGTRGETLAYGTDFIAVPNFHHGTSDVEAEVVFVGHGVTAPGLHHDDYAGIDVKGKIVAFLFGAPRSFPNDQRAYYGQPLMKALTAAEHGAVGVLLVRSQESERIFAWERLVEQSRLPSMRWLDAEGHPADAPEGLHGGAVLSVPASERLMAAAGRALPDVVAQAAPGHGFALGVVARLHVETGYADVASANVAALLPGSDPLLAPETVVLSAHLDHLGVDPAGDGDTIYNGAYDNASGVAGLLELARLFASAPAPRRSLLFLAVTGEERGLLGSDFYARHPTLARLVADVNLDMITMFGTVSDVLAYGAEHSSLGEDMARAAHTLGLVLSPDPFPEQSIFVRSDHFSFVRQGIPAVSPFPGLTRTEPGVDGKAEALAWVRRNYHTPHDDMSQTFDAAAGARLVQVAYLAARAVAQADAAPRWNEGDFFGETFGRRREPAPAP